LSFSNTFYGAETPTLLPMSKGDRQERSSLLPTVTPNLAASQHQLIGDMLLSSVLSRLRRLQ